MRAQTIYDITMSLMDERLDSGAVDEATTKDYKARAPGILSILQNEIALKMGKDYLDEITTLNGDIDLEDIICVAILPYGLASRLLGQEDSTMANYFSQLYEDRSSSAYLSQYKSKAKQVTRKDVYGMTSEVG